MAFLFLATTLILATFSCSNQSGQDSLARGQDLFDLHCAMCHVGPTPDLKVHPPQLAGVFSSGKLPSGLPATDAQVRTTILQGRGTMPAFDGRLKEQEVSDLLSYLHTLQ